MLNNLSENYGWNEDMKNDNNDKREVGRCFNFAR